MFARLVERSWAYYGITAHAGFQRIIRLWYVKQCVVELGCLANLESALLSPYYATVGVFGCQFSRLSLLTQIWREISRLSRASYSHTRRYPLVNFVWNILQPGSLIVCELFTIFSTSALLHVPISLEPSELNFILSNVTKKSYLLPVVELVFAVYNISHTLAIYQGSLIFPFEISCLH